MTTDLLLNPPDNTPNDSARIGDLFTVTDAYRRTDSPDHTFTLLVRITELGDAGPAWETVKVIAEANRPATGARNLPTGGSVAWFALPRYIADGRWTPATEEQTR